MFLLGGIFYVIILLFAVFYNSKIGAPVIAGLTRNLFYGIVTHTRLRVKPAMTGEGSARRAQIQEKFLPCSAIYVTIPPLGARPAPLREYFFGG